jgi:hypothetical protein
MGKGLIMQGSNNGDNYLTWKFWSDWQACFLRLGLIGTLEVFIN